MIFINSFINFRSSQFARDLLNLQALTMLKFININYPPNVQILFDEEAIEANKKFIF